MTAIAGVDADVRELLGGVDGKRIELLFTACRTYHAQAFPFGQTLRTEQ